MPEPLTKEEQKQLYKEALVEFLNREKDKAQQNIGAFVMRWVSIALILLLAHFTLHGKYQEWADYFVQATK